jgi:hypothetical protein
MTIETGNLVLLVSTEMAAATSPPDPHADLPKREISAQDITAVASFREKYLLKI